MPPAPMSFDPLVLSLVLLSALMHAAWNAVVKMGSDRLLSLLLVKGPTMFVAAGTIAVVGMPNLSVWPYLLGSALVSMGYFYFLIRAYHLGDLSVAYPVARGTAPVATLVLSYLFAAENPGWGGAVGVLIVSAGIVMLGWQRGAGANHVATILWAMAMGLTIAGYTILDGIAARISGNPIGYAAVLNIMTGVPLTIVAVALRRGAALEALKRDWEKGLAGGVLMFGAYAIVIYALTLAPMAAIAALRETGVIFAALIGTLLLRESYGAKRIVASAVVALGIIVLVVGI